MNADWRHSPPGRGVVQAHSDCPRGLLDDRTLVALNAARVSDPGASALRAKQKQRSFGRFALTGAFRDVTDEAGGLREE
jgi:hypothetical protein